MFLWQRIYLNWAALCNVYRHKVWVSFDMGIVNKSEMVSCSIRLDRASHSAAHARLKHN